MKSETSIVRQGLLVLRRALPPGWKADVVSTRGETRLRIRSPDGTDGVLAVDAKRRLAPGAVGALASSVMRGVAGRLLFAGWLSPLAQRALSEANVGYVDLTGNIDLRMARPGLFVRDVGASRDPEPAPSTLKSLKGAGAARAVRALVDFQPPYGVRELALASGASAALVSRVAALLEREKLITRTEVIEEVQWEPVLRRWAEDYSFVRTNRIVTCLDPRGVPSLLRKLSTYDAPWAATATLGVPPGTAVAPVQVASVYVRSPEQAMSDLGLTPTEAGANVLLVEPPDDGVFARVVRGEDRVVRCAPSQVVADLLTGPGRGTSEATALLAWMRQNEAVWRRRP